MTYCVAMLIACASARLQHSTAETHDEEKAARRDETQFSHSSLATRVHTRQQLRRCFPQGLQMTGIELGASSRDECILTCTCKYSGLLLESRSTGSQPRDSEQAKKRRLERERHG